MDPLTTRQRVIQGLPAKSLEGFPVVHYEPEMYRAARKAPWWFCTCGDCRFDIPADDPSGFGTLYAGTDPITGVLEIIGPEMTERPISREFLADRTIWTIGYEQAVVLADLSHEIAVGFGVTNELSTMVPYHVPQVWAATFVDAGVDGIRYRTRFSTGTEVTGIALFDEAGEKDWIALVYCRSDDDEIVAALRERLIDVDDVPSSDAMQIIS